MNDTDVERALTAWLSAEAGALRMPTVLRERVAGIPAARDTHRRPILRMLAGWAPVTGGVVAVAASVAVAFTLLNPFGDPPGAEGETCGNRQAQEALERLRTASGYRYVNTDVMYDLDTSAELSIENPQFIWTDALVSEGAYLAPDRSRETITFRIESFDRGYEQRVQIGDEAWELRAVDGQASWVRVASTLPTANIAYGYIEYAVPAGPFLGVGALDFGDVASPERLPGAGGCTAAATIDELSGRIVAVRVDVDSGRVTATYLGPSDAEASRGEAANTFEISWTEPPIDEFVAPSDFVPEATPNNEPPPSASPFAVDPSAVPSTELPMIAGGDVNGRIAAVAAGADRFVAVGGQTPVSYDPQDPGWSALVWTSGDGRAWELVDGPPGFDGLELNGIVWDGSSFLAIGYRTTEDLHYLPETWSSADGVEWEVGGDFQDAAGGDTVNVGIASGGPGWLAIGSVWSDNETVQRPAIFTSPDGAEWTRADLPGAGYGSVSTVTPLADGTLMAFACESPEPTNQVATGQICFMRQWRSTDGTTWTAGQLYDEEIWGVVAAGEGLLGIGSTLQLGQPALYESADGSEWEALQPLPSSHEYGGVESVMVTSSGLFAEGTVGIGPAGTPYAGAWLSADGGKTWEVISLGFPDGAAGTFADAMIEIPGGVLLVGSTIYGQSESRPAIWVVPAE